MNKNILIKVFLVLALVSGVNLRADESSAIPSVWWTWYEYPRMRALMELAKMRKWLQENALHDTYEKFPENVSCPGWTESYRTADGSCNNTEKTAMGAANIRFGRNVPLSETQPESESELLSPNPREVSLAVLTREKFQPVSYLNLLALDWIQFMTHDWFGHGENEPSNPFLVPLSSSDPFGVPFMVVPRTRRDLSQGRAAAPTYLNENTHWWDGSQIYGSSEETQKAVRLHQGGLLRVTDSGRIPIDGTGVEVTGFRRNWWVGLSLMHHLFTMEHNAIAKHLAAVYPGWDDEKLFQVARLINGAVMAKIHTVDWTPAILNNSVLRESMEVNWYGFGHKDERVKTKREVFLPDDLKGLVAEKTELHNVPFAMTEEFVSVYRMHPLLPETFQVSSLQSGSKLEEFPLTETRNEHSHAITDKYQFDTLFYSMGISNPGALTLNNSPKFLQNLQVPVIGKMDLGAVDILRDRERGVPRYNQLRRLIGLKPLTTFEDLSPDRALTDKLKKLYSGDVERLDAMVGYMGEGYRPPGYGFGETAFQIFILMASRRLEADRFFTTHYTENVYTPEGILWVEKSSLKSVLLRHFPQLENSLSGVKSAFNPWKK